MGEPLRLRRLTSPVAGLGLAAVLSVGSLVGCAAQAKKNMAGRLSGAAALAKAKATVTGSLRLHVQIIRVEGAAGTGAAGSGGGAGGSGGSAGTAIDKREHVSPPLALTADLAASRAELFAGSGGRGGGTAPAAAVANKAPVPVVLYDKWALYYYSPPTSASPNGASSTAAPSSSAASNNAAASSTSADSSADSSGDSGDVVRSWIKLDFATIKAGTKSRLESLNSFPAISPVFIVRLLHGVLTGSVRKAGHEQIGGVDTVHYVFNVDRDKATQGMPDKDRLIVTRLFQRDDLSGTVFKHVEAWLDADGTPRRILVPFTQRLDRLNEIKLGYELDLDAYGAPVAIAPPGVDLVSEVTDFPQLVGRVH